MLPVSSLGAKDRLRRTKSTRSIRRNRQSSSSFSSEPFDPKLARTQAMAAASKAMRRSNERSSMDSKRSYDRLGGPENLAVPPRRRPMGSASSTTTAAADESYPNDLATVCYIENQDTYPVALTQVNEFGGLDGRMSSLPSSYRRLRKAKSMFSTRQRAPQMSYGISSEAYGSPVPSHEGSTDISRPPGTLRRSMSFLRRGREPSSSIRHAKSQESAIQLARTQFLQNRKPSLVTIKPRREHKPFRRSFRTNSGSVMDSPGTPFSEQSKGSAGIHVKTRSFSSSIKKGLKRVLGLSKPPDESASEQETTAQSQWDTPRSSTDSSANQDYTFGSDYSYYDSPCPENSASPVRPPTMRSVHSSESLTSRSRVTSWADSTAANTVTPRETGERNPLSIIDENGTPGGQSRRGSPKHNASIDGQRLYSALMRHIGENINDTEEQVILGHVKEHRPIPERASSLHTCRSKQTIRQIPSDESMASPLSFATANGSMISPQRQTSRQSRRHGYQQPRYPQVKENDRFDETSSLRRQPLDSLFEIGEDSDDESGSIIVGVSRNLDEGDSPSVYSRTTSGDSPPKTGQPHETNEESGSATVYESQRTVYKSPKRTTGSSVATPTQPSGDWQKWMNNQMASLEFTPTREHYREEAQIHNDDDQDDINTLTLGMYNGKDTVRPSDASLGLSETGSTNSKVPAQSNFSRPFSRSSSMRSIAPSQKIHGSDNKDMDRGLSLSMRPSNRLQPESPTPKTDTTDCHQRISTGRRYPTSRMPVSREAKAAQFRSMRGRDNRRVVDENLKTDYGRVDTDPHRYHDGYSPMSSKQMVDRFLDSRRRQMETEMPEGDGPRGAFI